MSNVKIVVPWHNRDQLDLFFAAWKINDFNDSRFVFKRDTNKLGCAVTKNLGVEAAIQQGAKTILVLDDDCYPSEGMTVDQFIDNHIEALKPQPVELFEAVTVPASRGTPYQNKTIHKPVAASMGFWSHIGDYDAASQLVYGANYPMQFARKTIYGRYFPLCGMNLAFHASEWPWCKFVNVARFDDIWQGFLWQKKAYSEGKCFNLAGPIVRHSRQSNVWKNLIDESINLERNERIWQEVERMKLGSHDDMIRELGLSCD